MLHIIRHIRNNLQGSPSYLVGTALRCCLALNPVVHMAMYIFLCHSQLAAAALAPAAITLFTYLIPVFSYEGWKPETRVLPGSTQILLVKFLQQFPARPFAQMGFRFR